MVLKKVNVVGLFSGINKIKEMNATEESPRMIFKNTKPANRILRFRLLRNKLLVPKSKAHKEVAGDILPAFDSEKGSSTKSRSKLKIVDLVKSSIRVREPKRINNQEVTSERILND